MEIHEQLTKVQKHLKKNSLVEAVNVDTGERKIFRYKGIDEEDCPYAYCELHPKNKNICVGFLEWQEVKEVDGKYEDIDGEPLINCPIIGGYMLTVKSRWRMDKLIKVSKRGGKRIETKLPILEAL